MTGKHGFRCTNCDLEELDMPWRNLKYSTDWHLLTRQNSYNASKQKRHNAKDTNQFNHVNNVPFSGKEQFCLLWRGVIKTKGDFQSIQLKK
jgi:hypothetical protein